MGRARVMILATCLAALALWRSPQAAQVVSAATVLDSGGESVVAWVPGPDREAIEVATSSRMFPPTVITSSTRKMGGGAAEPVVALALEHDTNDRIFLVWQTRRADVADPVYRVWAQSLRPDGSTLWGPVMVTEFSSADRPSVVADDSGGVFVAVGVGEAYSLAHEAVEIRHLNADGDVGWVRQFAAQSARFTRPLVVTSGDGGLIVVFEARVIKDGADGPRHLFAQRLSKNGMPRWGDETHFVPLAATNYDEHDAVLIADGGGVIAAFESTVPTGIYAGNVNIAAQRIGPDGTVRWGDNGIPLWVSATTAEERRPALVADGSGGIIVAFESRSESAGAPTGDIWMQRIGATGELEWGSDGMPVALTATPEVESAPHLARTTAGNIIAAYSTASPDEHVRVSAELITVDGALLWSNPVRFAASGSEEKLVHLWSTGNRSAEAIIAETTADGTASLERWTIDETGAVHTYTAVPTAVADNPAIPAQLVLPAAPNPFNGETMLSFWASAGENTHLTIVNALGQRVRSLDHYAASPGWQRVSWDGRDDAGRSVASGTYLYEIIRGAGPRPGGRIVGSVTVAR